MLKSKLDEVKAKAQAAKFEAEKIDVTEPGKPVVLGSKHPITITIEEISRDIYVLWDFQLAEGPEVETVFNNFDALNAAPDHPARDMTDTFYITEETLLRTQTSPVQARTLMAQDPPIKVISPGTMLTDAILPMQLTHLMFHQVEGLLVGRGRYNGRPQGSFRLSFAKADVRII